MFPCGCSSVVEEPVVVVPGNEDESGEGGERSSPQDEEGFLVQPYRKFLAAADTVSSYSSLPGADDDGLAAPGEGLSVPEAADCVVLPRSSVVGGRVVPASWRTLLGQQRWGNTRPSSSSGDEEGPPPGERRSSDEKKFRMQPNSKFLAAVDAVSSLPSLPGAVEEREDQPLLESSAAFSSLRGAADAEEDSLVS